VYLAKVGHAWAGRICRDWRCRLHESSKSPKDALRGAFVALFLKRVRTISLLRGGGGGEGICPRVGTIRPPWCPAQVATVFNLKRLIEGVEQVGAACPPAWIGWNP
jgi:hypothetical protein